MNPTNHPAPTITRHAAEQAKAKGFTARETWLAMTDPDVTYPSNPKKYPGQVRRIRGHIVAVVETALRADQIAKGERIAS